MDEQKHWLDRKQPSLNLEFHFLFVLALKDKNLIMNIQGLIIYCKPKCTLSEN